jgi:YD repeat-containing protein
VSVSSLPVGRANPFEDSCSHNPERVIVKTLESSACVLSVLVAVLMFAPSVSAQSIFTHQIQIKVPKGANGMQPDLSLVYTPNAGNGMVGMGWQLTGLSAITRVNNGNGINFDGRDTYAHSQLGVLVAQADGSYRSKKESFTKLVPVGVCGDGPCSWVAYDPKGTKFFYGTTDDSRIELFGFDSVRIWGLSRVEDLFKDAYEVKYFEDPRGQFFYPTQITYTKGPRLTTYRTVEFNYEDRSDPEEGCYAKSFEQMPMRLKSIAVKSAGALLREYRLDYQYGSSTGRSELSAIQEYGDDGETALPAQTFGWQQGDLAFLLQRTATQQGFWLDRTGSAFLEGDFDGDGKTDIAYARFDNQYISIDMQLATENSSRRWSYRSGSWRGPSAATFLTGDFDGDGKTDVAYVFNDAGLITIDVYHATNRSSADLQRWETRSGAWLCGSDWQQCGTFVTGDFDGDGKTDIAYIFNENGSIAMDVHLSTGSSFIGQRWATDQGTWLCGTNWQQCGTFLLGDFNADGKTDVAYIFNENGSIAMDVHLSTGNSFIGQRWATDQGTWLCGTDWHRCGTFVTGDFNGDGKTDIVYVFNENNGISIDAHLSAGSYFTNDRWATNQGTWLCGTNWQQCGTFMAGDFNGDRKTDIAYLFNSDGGISIDVHVATGRPGGSFALQHWASNQGGWLCGDNWQDCSVFLPGDFNGDGKTDLAYVFNDSGMRSYDLHVNNSSAPDLMNQVNNGLGGSVHVNYMPAPQVRDAIKPTSNGPGIPSTSPQQLVTSVASYDGRSEFLRYRTDYHYFDARFYSGPVPSQRNLGFSYIEAVDAATGQLTRTVYRQDPPYEGRVGHVSTYTSAGQQISGFDQYYDVVNPARGTEFVRETQSSASSFELGSFAFFQLSSNSYDDFGNITTKVNGAEGLPEVTITTTYTNDVARWILGRITEVKTVSGSTVIGRFQNTWRGDVISEKKEWLDTANSWVVTSMTYDVTGSLRTVSDPSGHTTTTDYDGTFKAYPVTVTNALGQRSRRTYTADGLVASSTDPNNETTTIAYDRVGRKVLESRPDGGTTAYAYVNYGDPNTQYNIVTTKVDAARGAYRKEFFDGASFVYHVEATGDSGAVCINKLKDNDGRVAAVSVPHYCGGPDVWTTTTYDAAGRRHSVTTPDGRTTTYAYGGSVGAGRSETVTDVNGHATTKNYNSREKVTSVVDAANRTTRYTYDPVGRLIAVSLPSGAYSRISYDSLNRKISIQEPQLGMTLYRYDSAGNLSSVMSCRVASEEMLPGVVVASPEMLPASERVNMPSHQGRHHGQQDDAHGPDGTRYGGSSALPDGDRKTEATDPG